jgi:hypothetical protein
MRCLSAAQTFEMLKQAIWLSPVILSEVQRALPVIEKASSPGPEREHMRDRYVVFAVDGWPLGQSTEEVQRSLIHDWMLGIDYCLDRPTVTGRMTVFTTAPCRPNLRRSSPLGAAAATGRPR